MKRGKYKHSYKRQANSVLRTFNTYKKLFEAAVEAKDYRTAAQHAEELAYQGRLLYALNMLWKGEVKYSIGLMAWVASGDECGKDLVSVCE